jgi:hypothetical protein
MSSIGPNSAPILRPVSGGFIISAWNNYPEAEMSKQDTAYYRQRAETELELARCATSPEAAAAHRELASAYLTRAGGKEEPALAQI